MTGQARSIVVNADDAAQARRLGVRRGWTVESVHPVQDRTPAIAVGPAANTVEAAAQPAGAGVATVVETAAETTAAAVGPIVAGSRRLDRAAVAIGILGGAFAFAGVLLVACAASGGGSILTGLSVGLPVVAAGVLQGVTALAVHLLADLGRAVGDLGRGAPAEPGGERAPSA